MFAILAAATAAPGAPGAPATPGAAAVSAAAGAAESARQILDTAAVPGGLVVHLGCGDGTLTAALRAGDAYVVHGLDADAANVAKAREHIAAQGLAGKVAVDRLTGARLPYVDNLVNLLVADDLSGVPMTEVTRVLAPGGVACVKSGGSYTRTVKPKPAGIDEWTHYLHGPDNNAVAHDTVVGPPRHMQWLGGPAWTRNHHKLNSVSSVVTAKGRLFFIVDEATAANMDVPGKWALVGRDAFSGITLWKKPMGSWAWHLGRFRSGPPQVTRLLVTDGDRVYAPLGLSEPVSAVDAVTGKTLRTFDATAGAEEIILLGRTLLVLVGQPVAEQAVGAPVFKDTYTSPNRKTVVAVDTETGRTLWKWSDPKGDVMPETLAAAGNRAFVQVNESVACLDLASGRKLWTAGPGGKGRSSKLSFGTNVLVVADGVVLSKLGANLVAFSAADGRKLWECPAGGGFHAPLDLFVINGQVWPGDHPKDSVAPPPVGDFCRSLDLHTGRVKATNQVMVDLQTAGHHHRCYREKATDQYIITGKRGIEMMDLAGADHSRANWVRGTCQYGVLPANGLMYVPPNSCGCYMESLLHGFYALAAKQPAAEDPARKVADTDRLEKGPAYGQIGNRKPEIGNGGDWPSFRHDALRSGVAGTALPTQLKPAWQADLGGNLTQPVVADGKVLVADTDAGAVLALDAATGRTLWRHLAGGRVDSPPTVHEGLVLFGSADGRVTCLRLSDGALAWRFLAAPADLRAVAREQVESLWPVHGSVLVLNGLAYCSAGRSTWLDGGIDLYALEPATGKIVRKTRFESPHPKFAEGKEQASDKKYIQRIDQNTTDYKTFLQSDKSDSFSMAGGANSDVLVSDGTNVFLHQVTFSPQLVKQDEMAPHLFSTSNLLDGVENHRSHWVLGTGDFSRISVAYSWIVNRPGRKGTAIAVPTGVVMVFDKDTVWGAQRQGDANGKYRLFRQPNTPFAENEKGLPDFRSPPKEKKAGGDIRDYAWQHDLPVRPRAMLKAGDHLYMGVMPVEVPTNDPHAAYEGRLGGKIWVVSAKDGSKVAEIDLPGPVVWDGMAAADGRLYLATTDGKVVCMTDR